MDNSNLGMNKTQALILGIVGLVIFVSGSVLSYFRASDSLIGLLLINIGLWIHLYTVYFYGITYYPKWLLKICVWGNCGMTIGIILMVVLPQVR
ncbi:hypothetical protein C6497_00335 [Candidatus Poribacteria bacterium]|nr:MAG: hypothetical protein C6497_00335 [Candidatus Poribacteria bacterium]